MSLTRAMLKGMNLTEEQVSAIIEEHTNAIDGLRNERDQLKNDLAEFKNVKKELEDLKATDTDWKKKYEDEHEAYEKYKKDISDEKASNAIKTAYKKLLQENNVGESHIDSIIKVTDFTNMKLDAEGNLEDREKLSESARNDWSGFIVSTKTEGANVDTPPENAGKAGSMTKEQILAIKDGTARRAAMAENPELFGIKTE